jgi:hypothetical protein
MLYFKAKYYHLIWKGYVTYYLRGHRNEEILLPHKFRVGNGKKLSENKY